MSYRINYFQSKRKRDRAQAYLLPVAALLILLAVINGICCLNEELTDWRCKLFPWTQPEVRAACSQMLERISEGYSISDCIDAFCDEILHDTEVDS